MVKSITEIYDDKLIKIIQEGVELVHKVLVNGQVPEDLRIELTKWRSKADDLTP